MSTPALVDPMTSDAVTDLALIVMNMVIGISQEVHARRQPDQIALLTRPKVTLIRDGQEKVTDPVEVVQSEIPRCICSKEYCLELVIKVLSIQEMSIMKFLLK